MDKIIQAIKKNYKIIIALICIIIFVAILEEIFDKEKIALDTIIYTIVVQKMRTDILTIFFKSITHLGGAYILIGISILAIILSKYKKILLTIPVNLLLATSLNVFLKNIVQRPRPEGYRLIDETGYSFPSGHSMISAAFYGLLIYIIWKNVKNKILRNTLCTILSVLIILIGLSRIYLGVHYASDVIGGFVISIAYLIVFTVIIKTIFNKQK